jgi:hypothetical protein
MVLSRVDMAVDETRIVSDMISMQVFAIRA